MALTSIFDEQAERYDAWYETPSGRAIFAEELDAVRPLFEGLPRPWLEVGVGSGRFAAALGAEIGVDPAIQVLHLAARRGVTVVAAYGEQLPFRDATFGAVLFMLTLCFVADPLAALREARRVLRPEGRLVVGLVPAEGAWGRYYQARAGAGHPYYQGAHFFTRGELRSTLAAAGFRSVRVRSALCWPPGAAVPSAAAREGDVPEAGFIAVLAVPRP